MKATRRFHAPPQLYCAGPGRRQFAAPCDAAPPAPARLFACALALLTLLAACGEVPLDTVPVAAPPSPLPLPLNTRAEGLAGGPCGALWSEDEPVTLRGLYRTVGAAGYLDVSHVDPDGPPCWARFFLDQDLGLGPSDWEDPAYVEVVGLLSSSGWGSAGLWDVQVLRWTTLPLDPAVARSACRQAVAGQTAPLQRVDWASLALPGFVTGTAGFRPTTADLAAVTVTLNGADDRAGLLVLTARGPDLPAVRALVTRWVALECLYDMNLGQVVQITATIQGEVQE